MLVVAVVVVDVLVVLPAVAVGYAELVVAVYGCSEVVLPFRGGETGVCLRIPCILRLPLVGNLWPCGPR